MLKVDPNDLVPCREYMENPTGPHSPALQRLLNLLRWGPIEGRIVSITLEQDRRWSLGRLTGRRSPMEVCHDLEFGSSQEANRWVFKLRWQAATGQPLALGPEINAERLVFTPLRPSPVLGYADRPSATPGQEVSLMLSGPEDGDWDVSFHRLRCGVTLSDAPGLLLENVTCPASGRYPAHQQAIDLGSYAIFPELKTQEIRSFSLMAVVKTNQLEARDSGQAGDRIIAGAWQAEEAKGFALALDSEGIPSLLIGDGKDWERIGSGRAISPGYWFLLAVSFDSETCDVTLLQKPLAGEIVGHRASASRSLAKLRPQPSTCGFRLAAASGGAGSLNHFTGKIEAPRLWSRALSLQELQNLAPDPLPDDLTIGLLGDWDLSQGISGIEIVDCSGRGQSGKTVNQPTRAVTGALWDGTVHDWRQDPSHYAAIHFHDDDLHDCGWQASLTFTVPDDWRSGIYCAKVKAGNGEHYVTFFVRPPAGETRAPLALLLPTASYCAYANDRLSLEQPSETEQVVMGFASPDPQDQCLLARPDLGLSHYDRHLDDSGVAFSSTLRPNVFLSPGCRVWGFTADTLLTDWLEAMDTPYDVITDHDLEAEGLALLTNYRSVMTGTHPEYYSPRMLDAVVDYQSQGGRLIYSGGNGFYWRVAFSQAVDGIMEMRRAEDGSRSWIAEPGEYHHAFDGALGGLWARSGRAPQATAGVGFIAQGFESATYYERLPASFDPRAAWIFDGVGPDERIGDFAIDSAGAAGIEIDRADFSKGTPPHALILARADSFSAGYHLVAEEMTHAFDAINGETNPDVVADMVFYETAKGGAVFATGSIGWANSLCCNDYQNNVSRIFANVVKRFLDPAPFDFDPSGER